MTEAESAPEKRPLVGVAVIVVRNDRVLLGKRKGAHGEGTWALPGGHLEFFESIEACAKREVAEETGLQIGDVRHFAFTNDHFDKEGKHYVTLFVTAEHRAGEAVVREPEKCDAWEWFRWEALPSPRFLPLENLLAQGAVPIG
ncbi:MAG: NUDIX hydrolase [Desulfobacterales bacterium]|jgi:8-oxo-dGTP diphosphatase